MEYKLSHVRARMRPGVVPHKNLDGSPNVPKPKPKRKRKSKNDHNTRQICVFVPDVANVAEQAMVVKKEYDPLELGMQESKHETTVSRVEIKIEMDESASVKQEEITTFVEIKEEEFYSEDDAQ